MERRVGKSAGGAAIAVLALVTAGCSGADDVEAPTSASSSPAAGVEGPTGASAPSGDGRASTGGESGRRGQGDESAGPAPAGTTATARSEEAPSPGSVAPAQAAASGKVLSSTANRAVITDRGRRVVVLWGPSTQVVSLSGLDPSSIKVGACVLALPPSDSDQTGTSFDAALVRLLAPAGRCRSNGDKPSDDAESGGSDGSFEGYSVEGGGVIGAVTEVASGGFLVRPASGSTTQTYTVSTTPDTRFTRAGASDRPGGDAVEAGSCMTAYGVASSSGDVVQAVRIRLTAAVRGRCPSGAPTSDRD